MYDIFIYIYKNANVVKNAFWLNVLEVASTSIKNDIINHNTLKCPADDLLVLRIDGDTCLKVAVKLYMYKSKQKMKEKR